MIDDIVEKYLGARQKAVKKTKKGVVDKIRKPTAPATQNHGDNKKFNRKEKHKKKLF